MRRFAYRLERVLQYRRFLEKKAMLQLSKLKQEYRRVENRIGALNFKRIQVAEKCRRKSLQGVDAANYETYQGYLQKLKMDLDAASRELKEMAAGIQNQESVLKSESIKRKALETHKESRWRDYCERSAKEEQKFLDDLVILRQEVKI